MGGRVCAKEVAVRATTAKARKRIFETRLSSVMEVSLFQD
jgi:hypothetical protein